MKKIGIIAALILIFAVGMLWADSEERYTLNATIHIQANLDNVNVWYECYDGNDWDNIPYGTQNSGATLNYSVEIWPPNAPPSTVHASGNLQSTGQYVHISKPAGNWIQYPVILYLPEWYVYDPTIPETE